LPSEQIYKKWRKGNNLDEDLHWGGRLGGRKWASWGGGKGPSNFLTRRRVKGKISCGKKTLNAAESWGRETQGNRRSRGGETNQKKDGPIHRGGCRGDFLQKGEDAGGEKMF